MIGQRRALVTGGAGFIGSNLVDALLQGGAEVVILDDLSTGKRANVNGAISNGAVLSEISITYAAAVDRVFAEFRPEVVFHLAAQIDVRKSVESPGVDARINVEGTVNLLESARKHDVGRFVFSSSGGAGYGDASIIPTPEDQPTEPEAPYGQAKMAGEGYVSLFNRMYGLSTISLRYGNVFGPRQDPLGEAGVVAIFCGKALSNEQPIVYGDGTQTRDYVYVSDVVNANLIAAESDATGPLNIGTGKETSVLDLVELIAPFSDNDFAPKFESARLGELQRSVLDCGKASQVLGWRASVDLKTGIEQSIASTASQ